MAYVSRHNADTNQGHLASDFDKNKGMPWHGDFRECAEMASKIKVLERAAYQAGLNVAAAAIEEARRNIKENI